MKAAKKKAKVRQRTTKNVKRGSYLSWDEQYRILQDYAAGGADNSIRKLAIKYNRNEDTISRIVHQPKVAHAASLMLNQLLNKTLGKVVDRISYEIDTRGTKDGAWMAMELAEKFGAIPSNKAQETTPTDNKTQDQRTRGWVEKLTEQAMERGKQFGMPMPEIEETETEIRLEEEK